MIAQTLKDLNALLSDEIDFLAYLQFHKLIISELKCPKCRNVMSFHMENYMFQCTKTNPKSKRRCRTSVSAKRNSFFEASHLSIAKILEIICALKVHCALFQSN